MRSTFASVLLCCLTFLLPLSIQAQVSEPYCTWEDVNNDYHIARVNPATGTLSNVTNVPGMTGIVAPNTSLFRPTVGEYICIGYFANTPVWLRVNVTSGAILSTAPITENWVGVSYHCKNDTIYALREDNSAYELVWIDSDNATANVIAALPGISAHAGSSFSIDPDADTYTFVGLAGASLVIVTLDLNSGAILSQNPFPYNIPGQFFNCNDNKIWGLVENQQNMTYYLCEVQPSLGTVMPTYLLNGITPGFIAESATFNGVRNQFVYRGFDGSNNATIFAIDASNGSIIGSAPMTEKIAGLEDSLCCACPLPIPAFDRTLTSPVIQFADMSAGSPHSLVWDFGDGDTSHAEMPVHAYTQEGTYLVCLTATNNCGDSTYCDTIQISINSAVEGLAGDIRLSPNPANDRMWVDMNGLAGTVMLMAADGRKVMEKVVSGSFWVETEMLVDGVYFMQVEGENGRVTKRVVVRH